MLLPFLFHVCVQNEARNTNMNLSFPHPLMSAAAQYVYWAFWNAFILEIVHVLCPLYIEQREQTFIVFWCALRKHLRKIYFDTWQYYMYTKNGMHLFTENILRNLNEPPVWIFSYVCACAETMLLYVVWLRPETVLCTYASTRTGTTQNWKANRNSRFSTAAVNTTRHDQMS